MHCWLLSSWHTEVLQGQPLLKVSGSTDPSLQARGTEKQHSALKIMESISFEAKGTVLIDLCSSIECHQISMAGSVSADTNLRISKNGPQIQRRLCCNHFDLSQVDSPTTARVFWIKEVIWPAACSCFLPMLRPLQSWRASWCYPLQQRLEYLF
jgi:hypothetical protein